MVLISKYTYKYDDYTGTMSIDDYINMTHTTILN